MNNKRVLQKATKELDKAKAPVKKKDIIVDPMGQWKYPGQVTRIPSDTITMEGVDYPVLGVPDNGQPVMMQPGAYYDFPGANYVDEYPQMKKGGGLKTKKYTRSIEGTNYLFAESDLFKKPKKLSKKRIFHPNAKYYAEGGALLTKKVTCKKCGWEWDAADGGDDITTCHKCGGQGLVHAQDGGFPFKTELSPKEEIQFQKFYNTLPENLQQDDPSYDIRGYWDSEGTPSEFDYSQPKEDDGYYHAYSINGNTGEYLKSPWHPTFQHAIDEDRKMGYRPTVNVRGEVIATENPSIADDYIEADLTPEEIQEYAKGGFIVEDVLDHMAEGGDPGDIQCPPGYVYNPETKYCEKKSGCPDGYTFDAKSGRCVSKYEKESVKVYTGSYKYGPDGRKITDPRDYDISELKETTPEQLITATQREQQLWPEDNFNWPSDYTIKEILNPVYFLPSQTNWIDVNGTSHPFDVYPDLNYKVVVDPKKPEGFNKDENIYYVKSENTHQFKKYKEWELLKKDEKKIIADAEKRGYTIEQGKPEKRTVLPYDTYKQYVTKKDIDPNTGEVDEYETEEFLPGWDEKSFDAQNKSVSELYKDPEYLGYDAYNKSFDELYKDRPQLNKQHWSEQCPDCTYNHGYAFQVDPDYIYRSYNPNQNKVGPVDSLNRVIKTLENEYADPFAIQQMPTIEEYEYPEGPSYNPVGYKGQGIHPVWGEDTKKRLKVGVHPGKRSSLKDKFYVNNEWVPDRDFRGFGKHEKTKLIPSIVQKATGYDPQGMEGYYNEEGDWIPGEYENAEEEGRRINFNGAASLRDLKNQKEYEEQYAKFLKEKEDVDRLNKELRQQWLPQEEISSYAKGGASGCPPGYTKVNGRCVNTSQWQNVPEKNKSKSKKVQPFVTSDPDEYAYRKAAYDDSLYLVKEYNSKQPKAEKYWNYSGIMPAGKQPAVRTVNGFEPTGTNPNYSGSSRAGWSPAWEKYMKNTQNYDTPFENRPIGYAFQRKFFDRHVIATPFGTKTFTLPGEKQLESIRTEPRFKPPVQPVIFAKPQEKKEFHYPKKETKTDNTKKPVPPGKTWQGDYTESSTLDPKTGKVVTIKEPIYEDRLPIREPERGSLQPFVKINYPPGPPPYHGVEPNIEESEVPMYATPDPGAEFVPDTERYIDWDGNSIGFNGVRFRKPGHGGDLIKKGRRHYLHYPSIETRHSGDIVPEEEEFEMGGITKYPNGGESKPRKVRREVKPFTTSNLKEYQKRKQAYDDSLTLYKAGLEEYDLTTKTKGLIDSPLYEPEAYEAYKRLGYPKGYNVNMKRSDNTNTRSVMYEKPVQPVNKKTKPVPKKPQPVNKKSKKVDPFVTSDPKEYALRKAAYDDSLRYYNAYQMQDKLMGPGSKIEKNSKQTWTTKDLQAARKKRIVEGLERYGPIAQDYQNEAHQFKKGYDDWTATKADHQLIKYYKSLGFTDKDIMYHSSPDIVSDKIKAVGSYYDGNASSPVYRKPMQEVIFQKEIQEDSQIQPVIPIKQPQPPIQDNYPPPPPPPAGAFPPEYHGVEPDIQGDPIPEYATPDRDAQWVAQKERYIDWNGNNISYKLPRFRKPGHSGPLVKGSRTHYLRYPSIETRNSADIIPEEEEFAMGGEYNLGDEIELTEAEVRRLKSLGYIIEEV